MITRRSLMAGGLALGLASKIEAVRVASPNSFSGKIRVAAMEAITARGCPGVQVSVWRQGRAIVSDAFGFSNLETLSPASPASIFRIGSLTKQFTAALILKLADTAKLRVSDPVQEYLPSMKRLPSLTLLELMNHTAGLHSDDERSSGPAGSTANSQIQLADEIAAQAHPLDFSPGTAWLYSNANYVVLGAVIEKITRKSLRETLSNSLIAPLQLSRTAMDQESEVVKDRAAGYTPIDGEGAQSFANAEFIEIAEAGGAGAMRSTGTDLCAWHAALLSGRVLSAESLALMVAPGRLRDGRVSGANRFSAQDAGYGDVQYACGLLVQSGGRNGTVITHNGFINGFSAVLESYVDRKITFAVLCNSDVNPRLPFRSIRRVVNEELLSGMG